MSLPLRVQKGQSQRSGQGTWGWGCPLAFLLWITPPFMTLLPSMFHFYNPRSRGYCYTHSTDEELKLTKVKALAQGHTATMW